MTGRIWSWGIIKYRLMQSLTRHSPGKDAQTLCGSTHSLHTCFSQVAVTPCLSLWTGDTRLELLMLAKPICSTHWGSCFLQDTFQHLEICHGETGGLGKDSPATRPLVAGVFLLDWMFPEGCEYSEHSVCCRKCFLSYQTWVTASVLFYSDLWWLHYLPWNRKVHKRSALKVPTLEILTNWNEPLCPASRGTACKVTNFLNSLPNILRWWLSKHLIKSSGVLNLKPIV